MVNLWFTGKVLESRNGWAGAHQLKLGSKYFRSSEISIGSSRMNDSSVFPMSNVNFENCKLDFMENVLGTCGCCGIWIQETLVPLH
jgi:hypothetical protein